MKLTPEQSEIVNRELKATIEADLQKFNEHCCPICSKNLEGYEAFFQHCLNFRECLELKKCYDELDQINNLFDNFPDNDGKTTELEYKASNEKKTFGEIQKKTENEIDEFLKQISIENETLKQLSKKFDDEKIKLEIIISRSRRILMLLLQNLTEEE